MRPDPRFRDLAMIEPELGRLLAEARNWHRSAATDFCAGDVYFGYASPHRGLKARMMRCVGWYAGREELRTTEAYEIASRAIYEALPACRGDCACMTISLPSIAAR